jgi:hypothetical protein
MAQHEKHVCGQKMTSPDSALHNIETQSAGVVLVVPWGGLQLQHNSVTNAMSVYMAWEVRTEAAGPPQLPVTI